MQNKTSVRVIGAIAAIMVWVMAGAARADSFALSDALSYPYVSELVSAAMADRIAWVRSVKGVRNVWVAAGPDYAPRQVSQFGEDDGQELSQLTFSPDGALLVFVRGGDHDENWAAKGGLQPNPTSSPSEAKITLWSADPTGNKPAAKLVEGDAPAISAKGVLAYLKDGQVWTALFDGSGERRLFFDRGKDSALTWSPDGAELAFVSARDDDHAFIGVFTDEAHPITWMAPSTGIDGAPVWSPDGRRLAFTRRPGQGGPPEPLLSAIPHPWAIWTADAANGAGHVVWSAAETLRDSYPDVVGDANLHWAAGGRLTFLSTADNWPHLYAVAEAGGTARLLTPGDYMVEHLAVSRDGQSLIYSANSGRTKDDDDRRHLYRVKLDGGTPTPLTEGETLDWTPVALSDRVAFIGADPERPTAVEQVSLTGSGRRILAGQAAPAFPGAQFVHPRQVSFRAADGLLIHGQLFQRGDGVAGKPGVIFVHGGPPRQMMLGWPYMGYYANAYALNQYLAAHGFVVLSVNYRLGIGYGFDFQHPEHGGPQGASEYQDVVAGGRFLQNLSGVDAQRIGIWGGSYGGYLTALGLARNSDLFKAGVDLHGVHDWSRDMAEEMGPQLDRFERGDRTEAMAVAFQSSPVADLDHWTSPVLLIQGDDDRNVRFNQTIDMARRLKAKGIPYEELVFPDEIHGFLRYADWLAADEATAAFLSRILKVK